MPQPIFHQSQQFGIVARFSIEDALWIEARLKQCGRKQITCPHDPQNRTFRASRDPGQKQGGSGIIPPTAAFPRHLVQGIPSQP